MSITIVILDSHNGQDDRINRHIKYLVDQGLKIYRIHYNFQNETLEPGIFSQFGERGFRINVSFFQGKIKIFYFLLYCIRKKILKDSFIALNTHAFDPASPSIIHVHDPYLLPLAKMLVKKGLYHSKIVYDRHELYDKWNKNFWINIPSLFERNKAKSISGLVIVSDHHMSMTQKFFPHLPIVIVPNFPLSSFYDQNISKNKIQSFNLKSQINAIYIGSFDQTDRDVDLLLKVADVTLQANDHLNVIIGGKLLDAEIKLKIEHLSNKYSGRFHFLGSVSREKTIELTQKAHIGFLLIRPDTKYWVKTSPNKVYEYLICGVVPIIRSDIDHAEKLIKCSLIFNRFDHEAIIIKSVLDLIGDSARLKELMNSCKDLSLDYSWESVAYRYIDLYNRLLDYQAQVSNSSE